MTCGSVVKLLNLRNNVRLHSHDVKYGSGSGQQVHQNKITYKLYLESTRRVQTCIGGGSKIRDFLYPGSNPDLPQNVITFSFEQAP